MRPLALLTNQYVLLLFQQIIALWFLVDFFLARDSSTVISLKGDFRPDPSSELEVDIAIKSAQYQARKLCPRNEDGTTEAVFDKVILIIIDALGSNFVADDEATERDTSKQFKYTMPFVKQSIQRNKAISLTARAATPTVTMPRVKAILSGTIPSFMDIIHNLARGVSDFHQDNILQIAKAHGKSMVFYGDDTWLLLFRREMFLRLRETYSLFASDYTSVDTNVTEMALPEVRRDPIDWDYMFMHYLGLDHIGHTFGSNKIPLINEKLVELDKVVEEIHETMSKKRHKTLVVICGDHGMSKEGNHGGDSELESSTAMIFLPIGRELHYDSSSRSPSDHVNQIDLAATLSVLTGMPIPQFSRGVVIKKVLDSLWYNDTKRAMCACLDNTLQLARLADISLDHSDEHNQGRLFSQILTEIINNHTKLDEEEVQILAANEYNQLAKRIQEKLIRTITSRSNPTLIIIALMVVVILSLIGLRRSCVRLLTPLMTVQERLICLVAVLVPIFLLGSMNFIESERSFWPVHSIIVFLMFSLSAIQLKRHQQYIKEIEPPRVVLFVVTFLITALWNNWSLFHLDLGWFLPGLSVLILSTFSRQTSKLSGPRVALFFATGVTTFLSKIIEESNEDHNQQALAWMAFMQIVALALIVIETATNIMHDDQHQATSLIQKLATSWMWLGFLLSRSNNYVFLISNVMMEASLNKLANVLGFSPITRAFIYLQFSISAFYGQGNTNLFTSIDIKPAFYGQTKYHASLAIPLVACATFCSQIYWYLKLFQRVQGEKEQERSGVVGLPGVATSSKNFSETIKDEIKTIIDTRNFLSLAYFMIVCIILRNHIFIWSVISPKLVYHYVSNLILQLVTLWISLAPQIMRRFLDTTSKSGGDYHMLTTIDKQSRY